MEQELLSGLEEKGYKARVVSTAHLGDLQKDIEARHREGLFDEEFFQERLISFSFGPPADLPEAKSVVVVAVPDPQVRIIFSSDGEQWPVIVPPTYLRWREIDERVGLVLTEILETGGYRIAEAALPKKLLAVGSGLDV